MRRSVLIAVVLLLAMMAAGQAVRSAPEVQRRLVSHLGPIDALSDSMLLEAGTDMDAGMELDLEAELEAELDSALDAEADAEAESEAELDAEADAEMEAEAEVEQEQAPLIPAGQECNKPGSNGRRLPGFCQSALNCRPGADEIVRGVCAGNNVCCVPVGEVEPPKPPNSIFPPDRCHSAKDGFDGVCRLNKDCSAARGDKMLGGLCIPGAVCCSSPPAPRPAPKLDWIKGDGWWSGAQRKDAGLAAGKVFTRHAYYKIVLSTFGEAVSTGLSTAVYKYQKSNPKQHPHFTVNFNLGQVNIYQHVPIHVAAFGLAAPANRRDRSGATCPTDEGHAIQVRIMGRAIQADKYQDKYLQGIARLLKWISFQAKVKPVAPPSGFFYTYPNKDHGRMTCAEWASFNGVCGAMHVPLVTNTDPGKLNINRLLQLMQQ